MQFTKDGLNFSGTLTQEESDALDLAESLNPAETLEATVTGYVAHIVEDMPKRQLAAAIAVLQSDPQAVTDFLTAQTAKTSPPIKVPAQ